MKQVIQYLNLLPEPYSSQAIYNTSIDTLFDQVESIRESLLTYFIWDTSDEGHYYWKGVFEMARTIDYAATNGTHLKSFRKFR